MAAGDVDVKCTSNNSMAGAYFDGVDDLITTTATAYSGIYEGVTWSFWIYPMKFGVHILDQRNGVNGIQQCYLGSGADEGKIQCTDKLGAGTFWDAGIVLHKWQHLVITIVPTGANATKAYLYVDGVKNAASIDDMERPALFSWRALVMGSRYTGANYYKGMLKDVRIFKKDVSDAEALELYAGKTIKTEDLVHQWKLATDYNDSQGRSNGTNSGTVLTKMDSAVSQVITAQRAAYGSTCKTMLFKGIGGQVGSVFIDE